VLSPGECIIYIDTKEYYTAPCATGRLLNFVINVCF